MPEEVNRIMTDSISSWLFCPSQDAAENLHKEGVPSEDVFVVGDIMYDAVQFYSSQETCGQGVVSLLEKPGEFAMATLHRAENTDDPKRLKSLVDGLES